jgi:hypothetical protein
MSDTLIEEFDSERLERQQVFLIDRASAHSQAASRDGEHSWHRACAASLTRDAGSIALLRGRVDEALSLLSNAGSRFAELGIFAGYSLLELSKSRGGGMEEWWQENPKRREHFWQAMEMQFLEGSVTPDREEEPFLRAGFKNLNRTIGGVSA